MLRRSLFCVFFLLSAVLPLRADTFADASYHCSFEVPAGWRTMSSGDLSNIRSYLPFDFVTGAKSADGNAYVLVQTFRRTAGNPADSLKGYCSSMKGYGVEVESISVDDAHSGYVARMRMPTRYGMAPALSYTFFGSEDVITFHCFAPAPFTSASRETFKSMVDSFKFDSGYDYSQFSLTNLRPKAIGGLIVGTVLFIWRRSRRAAA